MTQSWVEKQTADPEMMKAFQQERLILEVTELISQLMEEKAVNKARLAQKLGKTKGYITQLLDGHTNMTLRTVSDVMFALGRALTVRDQPVSVSSAPFTSGFEHRTFQVEETHFGGIEIKGPDTPLSGKRCAA